MMPAPNSILGLTIELAQRELEAAVAALAAGDSAAAATAFSGLSTHADTARRILDLHPYDESEGESGGVDAFNPFQNRFKNGDDINPYPTGAGKDAETNIQPLTAPFSFLPESRLTEVAATRRAVMERRNQQMDQAPETATLAAPQHRDPSTPIQPLLPCLDTRSPDATQAGQEAEGAARRIACAGWPQGPDDPALWVPATPGTLRAERVWRAQMRVRYLRALRPTQPSLAGQAGACHPEGPLSHWWTRWLSLHPRTHVLLMRIYACLPPDTSNKQSIRSMKRRIAEWECRRVEKSVSGIEDLVSG